MFHHKVCPCHKICLIFEKIKLNRFLNFSLFFNYKKYRKQTLSSKYNNGLTLRQSLCRNIIVNLINGTKY